MKTTDPVSELREEMARIIKASGISVMELSRRSGVSYNALRMIAGGTGNPTMKTMEAAFSAIFERDRAGTASCMTCKHRGSEVSDDGVFLCELVGLASMSTDACAAHADEGEQND